jgi:hypothetical protein
MSRARIIFGLGVMLVGTMLLADRLDWWGVRVNVPLWPWILLLMGAGRAIEASSSGRPISRSGMWLAGMGVWGLVVEYQLFGITYRHAWPVLVLMTGLFMTWRALDPRTHDGAGKDGIR